MGPKAFILGGVQYNQDTGGLLNFSRYDALPISNLQMFNYNNHVVNFTCKELSSDTYSRIISEFKIFLLIFLISL